MMCSARTSLGIIVLHVIILLCRCFYSIEVHNDHVRAHPGSNSGQGTSLKGSTFLQLNANRWTFEYNISHNRPLGGHREI